MTEQKRGKGMALAGAVLQFGLAAAMLAIWRNTDSLSAMSCLWMLAVGVPLWLMAAVLFYCRQLERRETQELDEIAARGGPGASIFDGENQEVRPAAARLAMMERWVAPIFTLLWAGGHVALGILTLRHLAGLAKPAGLSNAGPAALITLVIGFAAFLFSRYATGMGTLPQWRLLRATGSYLLVNVLMIAGVVASLLAQTQEYRMADHIVAYLPPILQLVLAAELVLNFILDIYRPRVPGHEQRESFDSRLFNLAAQPGRVGHSIAETLNYQFGFEVSSTWFYQLLSRALTPLILLGALILFAMSSIVVVYDGWEAVSLRFGTVTGRTLKPGIHLKWFWPIGTVRYFNTGQVHEILLGAGAPRTRDERARSYVKGREVFTWTEEHGHRSPRSLPHRRPHSIRLPDTRCARTSGSRSLSGNGAVLRQCNVDVPDPRGRSRPAAGHHDVRAGANQRYAEAADSEGGRRAPIGGEDHTY